MILESDFSMASSMYLNSVWRRSISCCMEWNLSSYSACIFSAFSLVPIFIYSFSLSYCLASFTLFWDFLAFLNTFLASFTAFWVPLIMMASFSQKMVLHIKIHN